MTSIEQLIKQKLSVALQEERIRIATTLLLPEDAAPVTQPVPTPADSQELAAKKQAQTANITALQQKMSGLKAMSASAKDPAAMQKQLQALELKLADAQRELSQIK